jgi:lantibiotic modifying enzyme
MALFFAYLGQALGDDRAQLTSVRLIEGVLDGAAGEFQTAGLYTGFIGVAWALAHLDGWLLDLSEVDPDEAVDAALERLLTTSPWRADYDLIGGLIGIGVYALERLPRQTAYTSLNLVVARLAELAERVDAGARWRTPSNALYDLGLAHGVPGVIALLGKACGAGISDTGARRLFAEAATWLMGQRLPASNGASFPSHVAPGVVPRPSRSAWCYGDPGVAAALLVGARSAGAPLWEAAALAVAEATAARPAAECGVLDAGLCHGAAGLAHIFNRLYQATGTSVFHAAALRWVDRVFDAHARGRGVGGFGPLADGSGRTEAGLLEGAVGIGLVLLALATPLEPRWDRVLLLS